MMPANAAPSVVERPASIGELAQRVAELYARDTPFAFVGGGTEAELGNPPRALDALIETTGCRRIIDYAPADQTITVEAGMTIADVNRALLVERQFLAIDAPEPERATIGGAIATNLYGRRRQRFGGIKDNIVGIEIVRPDGTRARGGGKVVKNVAGFDMPKLMVGSLGTLGATVSATFRVHPIDEHRAAVIFPALRAEKLMPVCDALVSESLNPTAVVAFATRAGDSYDCCVIFEGFAGGVEQQVKAATAIAFRLPASADAFEGPLPAEFDERERAVRTQAPWRMTLAARPTELARFLAATPLPAGARCALYPMLGVGFVAADTCDAATIANWRAELDGGSVIVNAMPAHARSGVDAWGAAPAPALAIMRRLKANFDPKNLCNPGRFIGGM